MVFTKPSQTEDPIQAQPELLGGFPLTAAQRAIWVDQVIHANRPVYNTGQTIAISGAIDATCFVEAVRRVIEENDALRLRFVKRAGGVVQEISRSAPLDIDIRDFSRDPESERAAEAWIEQLFWKPLTPEDFPLFQFALATIGPHKTIWLQKYHHLIIDATGRQLVTQRVAEAYDALIGSGIPPASSARPSAWLTKVEEDSYFTSSQFAEDRSYWSERTEGPPALIVQTEERLSEKYRSGRPVRLECSLSGGDFEGLRELALRHHSSLFKILVVLAWTCFSRLYRTTDLMFGAPSANRRSNESKQTVGLFSKVMPFRPALDPAMCLRDALTAIDKGLALHLKHQRFPIDLARIPQEGKRTGLYDLVVNHVRADYGFSFGGAPILCTNLSAGFSTPWSIMALEHRAGHDPRIFIEYDQGRIDHAEAQRVQGCLRQLLAAASRAEDCPLKRLPMISPAAKEVLLHGRHGRRVPMSQATTIPNLFVEQVARTPRSIALRFGTEEWSYEGLNDRAEYLARRLATLGVGPESIVALCMPRSAQLIVCIIAIHKAGGAYLPIDPNYPKERVAFMLADAAPSVVLTDRTCAHLVSPVEPVIVDESMCEAGEGLPPLRSENKPEPRNLACILYTSGSTGKPKGVAVTHGSVANVLLSSRDLLNREDYSNVLFSTSITFDISVYEMFLPLISGGCVVLAQNLFELRALPACDQVRLLNTVPSLVQAFLEKGKLPAGLRVINLLGEAVSKTLIDQIHEQLPDVRLFNGYGPTETTILSTWSSIRRDDAQDPAIGRPVWNTNIYILDEFHQPVPDGAVGELWIGGAGVSRGYLNRPELTQERFIPNPFGEGRIYKTGDLVFWRPDGELGFMGRTDHQVKINGLRIELGEIEATLRNHPAVGNAVVTVPSAPNGHKRLVAYVALRSASPKPKDEDIRAHLARTLPTHMVPSCFIWLDAFPLTAGGKVDRRSLPHAPLTSEEAQGVLRSPTSDTEQVVRDIWQEFFDRSALGVDENYFDLGGDSLSAFWVIEKCNAHFSVELPLTTLFQYPTVALFASLIDKISGPRQKGELIPGAWPHEPEAQRG